MNFQRNSNSLSTRVAALTHPPAAETSMPVVLLDWKPVRRNTLRGYAKVLLGRTLMIGDVPVNVTNGRPWAALPSKPVVIDARHAVDTNGKPRWNAILEWASDGARHRFSDAVVRAVLEAHPHALGDDQ